jgi:hypothetical protein
MPKITVSNCKCQITEKCIDIPSQKLDTGQQIKGLTCNIQTQLSETKESVQEQYNVKEHTAENNILHGASIDQVHLNVRVDLQLKTRISTAINMVLPRVTSI